MSEPKLTWHHPLCEGECFACLIERTVKKEYGEVGLRYLLKHINVNPVEPLSLIDWQAIDKEQLRRYEEKFGAIPVESVNQEPDTWCSASTEELMLALGKSPEEAKRIHNDLENCVYVDSIDFEQTPPYLRYDTGDNSAEENWDVFCDIQEDLRKVGYELTDSYVDHDTVCGDVTPITEQAEQESVATYSDIVSDGGLDPRNAVPVRTKDLTDDEIWELDGVRYADVDPITFARAVIAADREKNK